MSRLLSLFGALTGPRVPLLSSAVPTGAAISICSGEAKSFTSAAWAQLRAQRGNEALRTLWGETIAVSGRTVALTKAVTVPAVSVLSHHALAAARYLLTAQCGTYAASTATRATIDLSAKPLSSASGLQPPFKLPSVPKDGGAKGKAGAGSSADADYWIDMITGLISPVVRKLSFAGFLGFCCGTTVRKIGELVAEVIGGVFIFLQLLAWRGYITIHYGKVKQDLDRLFCRAKDGEADTRSAIRWALEVLAYNVPNAGGFFAGFYYGLAGLMKRV